MKNKMTAALFAGFLGWIGVHRFYLGQVGLGIVYALTGGLFGIGFIADFIIFLTMSEEAFNQKYNAAYSTPPQQQIVVKPSGVKIADELKKLHELKEAGILTEYEYESQKQNLLA